MTLSVEGQGSNRALVSRLYLADDPATGVAGRTISFYANGELIDTAMTDEDGVATVVVPARNRGSKQTFEARFAGDDQYTGASARS